jgi:hypothetical protein
MGKVRGKVMGRVMGKVGGRIFVGWIEIMGDNKV